MNRLSRLSTAIVAIATGAAAQGIDAIQHRGPLVAMPFAFSGNVPPVGTNPDVRFRALQPTPSNGLTQIVPTATEPDYTFASIVANLPSGFSFNAISALNDAIPHTTGGLVEVGSGTPNWGAIVFSVDNNSGETWPELPSTAGGAQGSHLVSYWFEGSVGIGDVLPGANVLEVLRSEAALPVGADIDALDFSMGLLDANSGIPIPVFAEVRDEVFFTVSRSWALTNETYPFAEHPAGNGTMVGPDAGVIYRTKWNAQGGPANAWRTPRIYRDRSQLGLLPGRTEPGVPVAGDEEAIDMLMVSVPDDTDARVYFSTRKHPGDGGRNQLLTLESTGIWPLLDQAPGQNPQPVTNKLNIGGDKDIDAGCGYDPEANTTFTSGYFGLPREYRYSGVSQVPGYAHLATPISLSIGRRTRIEPAPASGPPTVKSYLDFAIGGLGQSTLGTHDVVLFAGTERPTDPPTIPIPVQWTPILSFPWTVASGDTAPMTSWSLETPIFGSVRVYFEAQLLVSNPQNPNDLQNLRAASWPVIIK